MPNEETIPTASPSASATPEPEVPAGNQGAKTYSEEEFNRAKQSASSIAKGEILKELGITSVEQAKTLFAAKTEGEKKLAELEASVKLLTETNERSKEDAEIAKSGVDGKHEEDLRILAKSKMKDGATFSQAISKTLEENPFWKSQTAPIALGPTVKEAPKKGNPATPQPEKW